MNSFYALSQTGKNQWWRYALTIILVIVFAIIAQVAVMVPAMLVEGTTDLAAFAPMTMFLVIMSPFPFIVLALWIGVRFLHGRPFSSLFSSVRFRWGKFFSAAVIWFVLAALSDVILSFIYPGNYTWIFNPERMLSFVVPVLILTPLQTLAEELLFRAYLPQAFARWKPAFWLVVLIPALIFGLLHSANTEVGAYGIWLTLPFYILFGVLTGWLVYREEGIESAYGIHLANNLYAGLIVSFASQTAAGETFFRMNTYYPVAGLIVGVVMMVVYLGLHYVLPKIWRLAAAPAILILILLGGCTPQPVSTPVAAEDAATTLALSDCRLTSPMLSTQVKALCGALDVPENPADPQGKQITLNVVVIPAEASAPLPDPVFLIAGGPGQAATESFLPILSTLDQINFKHDLVMVDQRGTGKSNPLTCADTTEDSGLEALSQPEPAMETQLADLQACVDSLDADLSQYTTENAVSDLEAVRKALNYDQINLLGVSYGTRVSLIYAQNYPSSIRSLILDSVEPMDWALGESLNPDAERALSLVLDRCSVAADCAAAFPDISTQTQALLDSLDVEAPLVNVDHPVTGEPLQVLLTRSRAESALRLMLYTNETTALIPLVIHSAWTDHDYRPLVAQYLILSGSLNESLNSGLYLSVLCAEDMPLLAQRTPETGLFTGKIDELTQACSVWKHAELSADVLAAKNLTVPALLLAGEADPVTPPENAEAAAAFLANSQVLTIPAAGHNVVYRGCIPRIVRDFISAGSVTGLDTACINDLSAQPFLLDKFQIQP